RALHPDLPDLVNVDGGAEIVRELREAPVDAVADAAAARLVTRKPLSVQEQRGHATRGERHRGHRAGGTAADDDDVGRLVHGARSITSTVSGSSSGWRTVSTSSTSRRSVR